MRLGKIFLICFLAGLVSLAFICFYTLIGFGHPVYTSANAPYKKVAIVFGAGVRADQTPSMALLKRIEAAVELYKEKKAEILFLSGDNRFIYYNEPKVMKKVALQMGVPESAILLDYAGRRTYDTCYRAKNVFNIHEALIVSQPFHLSRASFICEKLGINTLPVTSKPYSFPFMLQMKWYIREAMAILTAWWDIYIYPPKTLP